MAADLQGVVGGQVNYTYTDGVVSDGSEMVGNSKNTYNAVAFYDDGRFNARLAYTYRVFRPSWQA